MSDAPPMPPTATDTAFFFRRTSDTQRRRRYTPIEFKIKIFPISSTFNKTIKTQP